MWLCKGKLFHDSTLLGKGHMDFTKDDLKLMNDLINITWQSGAVKAPQMGQALENLRGKVLAKLEPIKPPEEKKGKGLNG